MVRAIVLTALVASVASGFRLDNSVNGFNLVRRAGAEAIGSQVPGPDAAGSGQFPGPDASGSGQGPSPDAAGSGQAPGFPDAGGSGDRLGGEQATSLPTGSAPGFDGPGGSGPGGEQTGLPQVTLPTRTGLPDGPIETGPPLFDAGAAQQTGLPPSDGPPSDGPPVDRPPFDTGMATGLPSGVASPTGGAQSTDTPPVQINEGPARPVGRVTVLLGLGAVALAIGLS